MHNTKRSIFVMLLIALSFSAVQAGDEARQADGPMIWTSESVYKWVRDGFEHLNQNDLDRAEQLFRRAIKRTRQEFELSYARYGLAAVLLEQGKTNEAKALLERVIEDNQLPDSLHLSAIRALKTREQDKAPDSRPRLTAHSATA